MGASSVALYWNVEINSMVIAGTLWLVARSKRAVLYVIVTAVAVSENLNIIPKQLFQMRSLRFQVFLTS